MVNLRGEHMRLIRASLLALILTLTSVLCFAQVEYMPDRKNGWGLTLEGNFNDDYTKLGIGGFYVARGRIQFGGTIASEAPHGSGHRSVYEARVAFIPMKSDPELRRPSFRVSFGYECKTWDGEETLYPSRETRSVSHAALFYSTGLSMYFDLRVSPTVSVYPLIGIGLLVRAGDDLRGGA